MKRDYATTFFTEVLVLTSSLLVYRLVAQQQGSIAFAAYALGRRTLTLVLPLCVVGLDVALARYVAFAAKSSPATAHAYLTGALLVGGTATALTSAVILAAPVTIAELLFGAPELADVIRSLPVLLAGALLHVISYANLRGSNRIGAANAVMAVNHAAIPLVAFGLFAGPVARSLVLMGVGWITWSSLVLAFQRFAARDARPAAKELLVFGLRRLPGDLVQLLLFALPAMLFAHITDLREAGIVALGITAIGLVGSSLAPVSFVLLPHAAALMARGAVTELRAHVRQIVLLMLPILVAGTLLVEVIAEPLLAAYLGPEYAGGADTLRILMLAAVPYGLYVMLKSVIDARHVTAVNARNMVVAFALFVVIAVPSALASTGLGVLVAFVVAVCLLGILTVVEVQRALAGEPPTGTGRPAYPSPIDTPPQLRP